MEQRARFLDAGVRVDFNEPHVEVLIDDEIIAEDLEAIFPVVLVEPPFGLRHNLTFFDG